jgi:glucose-1-phosphate thymidylyltransferase
MKALVLCGGAGTRLNPATASPIGHDVEVTPAPRTSAAHPPLPGDHSRVRIPS